MYLSGQWLSGWLNDAQHRTSTGDQIIIILIYVWHITKEDKWLSALLMSCSSKVSLVRVEHRFSASCSFGMQGKR